MSRTRVFRVVATSARLTIGAAVAVACAVGVVAAIHAPWPEVAHTPAQVEVDPIPSDPVLVCNGDFRALGRDSSNPLSMRSAGSPSLTEGGTSGAMSSTALSAPDLADAGEAQRLTDAVDDRTAPLIAAAESLTLASSDLAGFAALPCGESAMESWLVGGSVDTGTKDLIALTNASAVTSTVTLAVYGESRSTRTVIVPAMTQVALSLASVAAGNEAPIVKISTVGAPVRAVLQSSFVRTLDPAGIDLQDAVAGPQQHPVIVGVQSFDGEGDSTDQTVLRMLSPGVDTQATVSVHATGSTAVVDEFSVPLPADAPTEVSLPDLDPGSYSVEIAAEAPVVAAVRQQQGFGSGSDFAWVTPAPEISTDVLFAVPAGPTPVLQLVNTDDAEARVTIEAIEGGTDQEIVVPAGGSAKVELVEETVYRLDASGSVRAAMTMTGDGAVAAWPLQPSASAAQSITVYP